MTSGAEDLAARFEAEREKCEAFEREAVGLPAKKYWRGRADGWGLARDMARAGAAGGANWTCAARRQGTAGGNDPADCDWPFCGCDPYADKVVAALQEAGRLVPASLPGGTGSADET